MNIKISLSEFISDEKVKAGIWYCLLNSVFVLLISTKYFFLLFSGVASVHPVYSVMACVSHFFALCMLPFLLIFLPIYSLLKNYRLAKWVSIVMSVLSLIVLTIDAYVFSLYRFHLNIYVLEQVFGPASGQVFEFSIGQYIMVVLFLLLLLSMRAVCLRCDKRHRTSDNGRFAKSAVRSPMSFLEMSCNGRAARCPSLHFYTAISLHALFHHSTFPLFHSQ